MLTRREFLRTLGLAAGAASLGLAGHSAGAPAMAGADKGINILFLMTDEHGYKVLGAAGNAVAHTPNLDRLAREGVFFENAFVPVPYCSPTRASLISGQWPHHLRASLWSGADPNRPGILGNINTPHGVKGTDFPSTEMILFEHGWKTAHFGKWHLGDVRDFACYASAERPEAGFNRMLDDQVPAAQFAGAPGQGEYLGRPVYMTPAVVE
ncbi:MAG: sulfatase-like hydrolase/transferase, partial [bacterium]|nr:sulfatase-like hydrolase/transferase [bacterium]